MIPALLAQLILTALALVRAGTGGVVLLLAFVPLLHPSIRSALRSQPAARLAWLAPGVFVLPDLLFGSPATARLAVAGAGAVLVAVGLLDPAWVRAIGRGLANRRGAALAVAGVLLWCGVATLPIEHGSDVRLGQDTAYFTQVVLRAAHGQDPRGDVVTALLYDPPLRSHFGAHVSPVLYALAPFLRIFPDWQTLAFLRSAGLLLAALVLWRSRTLSHELRGFALLVWWLHPSLWTQPMHTVYLLPLAAPGAVLYWIGVVERRWRLCGLGLFLVALVREDAALFVGAGGWLASWGRRGPTRWGWAGAVAGLAWYVVATMGIMPRFGPASGQAVAGLFDDVGGPLGLITHPDATLRRLAAPEAWRSLWHHLRSTGMLALLHPVSLAAIPAQAVNALANVGGFGTLHPAYHYAILPATAMATGAALAIGRYGNAAGLRLPRLGVLPWSALLAVVLTGALMSSLDTLDPGKLAAFRANDDIRAARSMATSLPASWKVAAPRAQLPWLAGHAELYLANRLADYPQPQPDAWLVTTDVASLQLRDGTEPAYRDLLDNLPTRSTLVAQRGPWRLYVRSGLTLP